MARKVKKQTKAQRVKKSESEIGKITTDLIRAIADHSQVSQFKPFHYLSDQIPTDTPVAEGVEQIIRAPRADTNDERWQRDVRIAARKVTTTRDRLAQRLLEHFRIVNGRLALPAEAERIRSQIPE